MGLALYDGYDAPRLRATLSTDLVGVEAARLRMLAGFTGGGCSAWSLDAGEKVAGHGTDRPGPLAGRAGWRTGEPGLARRRWQRLAVALAEPLACLRGVPHVRAALRLLPWLAARRSRRQQLARPGAVVEPVLDVIVLLLGRGVRPRGQDARR